MTAGFNLTELLKTNETLVKELSDVKVQLRLAVEGLKVLRNTTWDQRQYCNAWMEWVNSTSGKALEKIDKKFK